VIRLNLGRVHLSPRKDGGEDARLEQILAIADRVEVQAAEVARADQDALGDLALQADAGVLDPDGPDDGVQGEGVVGHAVVLLQTRRRRTVGHAAAAAHGDSVCLSSLSET